MTEEAGLVLYVIAYESVRPRGGKGLKKRQIIEHTNLSRDKVDESTKYLIDEKYLELKGHRYYIHKEETQPYLIRDLNEVEIVWIAYSLMDRDWRFALDDLLKECNKQKGWPEKYVHEMLTKDSPLTRKDKTGFTYLSPAPKPGFYELQRDMFEEERPYLANVRKYRFKGWPSELQEKMM